MKIALANLPFTGTVDAAVSSLEIALRQAASAGAKILCTPENYLPGLRDVGFEVESTSAAMLDEAHSAIGELVKQSGVGLVLGSKYCT